MSARSLDLPVHDMTCISTLLVGLTSAEIDDVICVQTCWEAAFYGCQPVELFRKRGMQHAQNVRCSAAFLVRARASCASEVGASGSVAIARA